MPGCFQIFQWDELALSSDEKSRVSPQFEEKRAIKNFCSGT
ncbi:Uncharacterized protein dnm_053670 [Desulfonema magnum]|uniref:Uncharacterized protein n=1 Tax=Desulfonema magnum TaxID=45655 RepID=A0A975BPI3_9BACT|nr:Uncharacterized protein dnm_053670 [Desulfonema magnum]